MTALTGPHPVHVLVAEGAVAAATVPHPPLTLTVTAAAVVAVAARAMLLGQRRRGLRAPLEARSHSTMHPQQGHLQGCSPRCGSLRLLCAVTHHLHKAVPQLLAWGLIAPTTARVGTGGAWVHVTPHPLARCTQRAPSRPTGPGNRIVEHVRPRHPSWLLQAPQFGGWPPLLWTKPWTRRTSPSAQGQRMRHGCSVCGARTACSQVWWWPPLQQAASRQHRSSLWTSAGCWGVGDVLELLREIRGASCILCV